jgi:hypothetical protein
MTLPLIDSLDLRRLALQSNALVEDGQYRFAHPGHYFQFRRHVHRIDGSLQQAHGIENHARPCPKIKDKALTAPQFLVEGAVPTLSNRPGDPAMSLPEPSGQAEAVAEPRGVPQPQGAGGSIDDQIVRSHGFGYVRRVLDLADVLAQQRANQRCLADVGMRHQEDAKLRQVWRGSGFSHLGSAGCPAFSGRLLRPCGDPETVA